MSFVVKAIVYMTSAEYDAVEVKRGDIEYVVDYGDRLRSYLGDILVESLTFSDFTQDQIDEIKSAAQEAAEASAAIAVQAADAASASENAAKGFMEFAKEYADTASKAEGYDESARKAAESALNSAASANTSLLRTIAERVLAQSYAIGGTNTRPGEDTDNAKYYMQRAQAAAEGVDHDWSYIESVKDHVDEMAAQVEQDMGTTEGYKQEAEQSNNAAALSESNAHDSEVAAKASENAALASQNAAHDSEVAAKGSEDAALASQNAAHDSEVAAKGSENAAALSESNAHNSEVAAKASEDAAALSESNAHDSEVAAKASEDAASLSESNAHASEVAAAASAADSLASQNAAAGSAADALASQNATAGSAAAALASQGAAHDSEVAAKASEDAAIASQNAAAQSESNALGYKNTASQSAANAHDSEVAAKASEDAAALSAQHAASSESAAAGSATAAEQSAVSAYNSKNDASASATAAHNSEVAAAASESQVAHDASEAASSAAAAEQSEQDAAAQAKLSESWAVGETGVRPDEDTNNAKYWAEQARQASPEGKADKVIGAVEGHLAGLDSTGNLTDSGIPSDNVALQDGSYDTLHAGTAGNLVDDRAPSTGRKFGFDTACGDVSISDDGTADPTLLKGTTYVKNQLVGDSKVVKELGQGVVISPYAVSGDIDHAYIKGRSLVRNQLVPASVEKEGSSTTGVVEVPDAVAGDALALRMVASRSVVVNQWMQNGDFSSSDNWVASHGSMSVSDNVLSFTGLTDNSRGNVYNNAIGPITQGHVYLIKAEVLSTVNWSSAFASLNNSSGTVLANTITFAYVANTWTTVSGVTTATSSNTNSNNRLAFVLTNTTTDTAYTASIRKVQFIDLTQYFNGDQTLIDSITSWDDLVAYDPRFAQYVEYNAGTVVGVQPSVYVGSPNLFNIANLEGATNISISGMTITLNALNVASGKTLKQLVPSAKVGDRLYLSFASTISLSSKYIWLRNGSVVDARWDNNTYHTIANTEELNGIVKFYAGQVGETITNMMISLAPLSTYEPYHDGVTAQAPAPLFAVGNAADEYEAVSGTTTRKMGSYTFTGEERSWQYNTEKHWGYLPLPGKKKGEKNLIMSDYPLRGDLTDKYMTGHLGNGFVYIFDTSFSSKNDFLAHIAGKTIYYELATPTTSTSTPTQISLQAGSNVAMQTDGGRTTSSLALGYDGTSFDVPLKTGRSYLVKKGSTSTLVTDGTTQSVTGGQDMIVDLNTLYNNVSALITPVTDWNSLVSDTGMYGSYTAYDEGTVVHSDQTEVKVTGKNLCNGTAYACRVSSSRPWLTDASNAVTSPYVKEATSDNRGVAIKCPVNPLQTYTVSSNMAGHSLMVIGFYENEVDCTNSSLCLSYTASSSFTVPTGAHWAVIAWTTKAEGSITWTQIQLELGSTATSYEPYYNGGTATAGLLKGIPGSVYDQLDAITGNVTTRIGSYTFTGNEDWGPIPNVSHTFLLSGTINNAYRTAYNATVIPYMMSGYDARAYALQNLKDKEFNLNSSAHGANTMYVRDDSCTTAAEIQAKMAGKTVYYRLATYSKSTTTPQPLTQPTGGLTVLQTAGTLIVPLDAHHAVSEWDEPIVRNCKYIFRDNGVDSLVTGSTTVTYKHVVGGQHKLINLTQWFGRTREPSLVDFYKLFPTWKDADIPYDGGTILNYKGTGVRTIGFNAYNNATGTAVLLGGNQYQICGTYTSCTYTDQWGNAEELSIDDKGIFTPVNNGTLTVVGGNDTDTCVHLCWSGYKNYGEPDYEWFPYEEKGVSWDLSQWFPNGMNGIGARQDEMTNSSLTQRFGIVDLGTLGWNKNATSGNFSATVSTMDDATGRSASTVPDILCEGYPVVNYVSGAATAVTDGCMTRNTTTGSGKNIMVHDSNYDTAEEFKEAVSGIILIYPLATPVTSEVTPTQNFSYPVNDFGTEQSLPVNTLTLLTTDLDADIRYSLDFTRTVAHYAEIENDVKQLVEEKDNLARQDGNYGDKGGVFNYATQLLDPNAPPTEASYGNRTAAGDVSIADNGTADVTSLQGTTQIQNQLVHDTNMNTKSSVDGRLVLTDAVGGQLSRLEIHGGCVVHNQLVKESIEKIATGTGRLGCEDGVAGNAKSLLMTAPRSVVMNQLSDSRDGSKWVSSASASITFNDNVFTVTSNTDSSSVKSARLIDSFNACVNGHKYALYAEVNNTQSTTVRFGWRNYTTGNSVVVTGSVTTSGNWEALSSVGIAQLDVSYNEVYLMCYIANGSASGTSAQFRNMMCVDLTQYFNGNTTLINSINTWDDLVAYDSTFASYVPYDTGTVKGVQPTVKVNHTTDVACPVELFAVNDTTGDTFDGVSGVVTRKMGVVDLGTLDWQYKEATNVPGLFYFGGIYAPSDARAPSTAEITIISDKYISAPSRSFDSVIPPDKSIMMYINKALYVFDSAYTDATAFKTAMSGVMLYYELATPTTEQYTPTNIPTVDIYNTALQTAGTRPCGLSLTYDGKDQTIALNPSHTYVFNDNQEDDSVITGQSSIEAVGGEDQLVDITQLYNGDATKIANIHSWASLSTRFHRYRDFQPYNPGTVEPDCPVIRKFDNEHAYGIIYDPSQNTPACQWVELNNGVLTEVSSFADFSEIPCHELQRCVMDDLANRHVAYYLDDEDSDKKYNGTRNGVTSDGSASVLTGADGDVMSELPIGYWDLDEDWEGTGKRRWLISDRPFMGSYYPAEIHDFFYVGPDGSTPRKQYVGSYRGCICDADGNPLNTTEGALAQVTGTASTNKVRSIKGALPYVSVSLNDFTVKSGRNGGSSVNVKYHQWLFLLMAIEKGSLDNQLVSQGYSGGINNAFCFWRKSGRVNHGNGTGEITAVEGTQDMDNFQRFVVGSTTVQRDTLMDADGRYAWSVYNRNASSTRYFTSSPTPSNGDPVYTASTGTTTAGTVASYTMSSNRVIQFQYRGIENPFGEVWEFEHGIQKFQTGEMKSFRGSDNVTYTRSPENDGVSSRAWTDPSDNVFWTTTGSLTTSTFLYSDPSLTTATTVKYKDQPVYRYSSEGYWETLATDDYTMTAQRTSANPVYTVRHNHWPLSGWDTKFDPVTFFMRKTGSPGAAGRYIPDYWYNDGGIGDRVAYVGGSVNIGSNDGLAGRDVHYGLGLAYVDISGRPSA